MADVVHEEEAYISCSSSDYDEHADLSTDAEDLADTDSEGSAQHLGIEPYQCEPYLSDAGGWGRRRQRKRWHWVRQGRQRL